MTLQEKIEEIIEEFEDRGLTDDDGGETKVTGGEMLSLSENSPTSFEGMLFDPETKEGIEDSQGFVDYDAAKEFGNRIMALAGPEYRSFTKEFRREWFELESLKDQDYQNLAELLMAMPNVLKAIQTSAKVSELFVKKTNSNPNLNPLASELLLNCENSLKELSKILNIINNCEEEEAE